MQQHTGVHSAWVSLPPSRSSFRGSGSGSGAARTSTVRGSSRSAASRAPDVSRERKRRSPAAAPLLCTLQRDDERHHAPPRLPPFSLLARLGGAAHYARGRGVGGFRLGAVTAVRSPGDGGGTTSTMVGGGEELKEAFNAAAGEEELLGLAGFRVGIVYSSRQFLRVSGVVEFVSVRVLMSWLGLTLFL